MVTWSKSFDPEKKKITQDSHVWLAYKLVFVAFWEEKGSEPEDLFCVISLM